MHGENIEAQPPMGLKGGSGDGGVRSYQVPSKVQGEARYACEGRSVHGGCMEVHEAVHEEMKRAQECMGVHGASTTWVMHDAWGAHGGPTTNGA